MEPDDAFLNALLSAPMPRRKKAKVRVPGQPPPSTDGELAAELRTSGASLDAVEIHQPSTGWTATVVLPAGEAVDIESLAVQRSKRSGTVYLRYLYEVLADHPVGNSAPAREPEPEPAPESARAAASRQARVKILTASRQVTTSAESAGSEHGGQSEVVPPVPSAGIQSWSEQQLATWLRDVMNLGAVADAVLAEGGVDGAAALEMDKDGWKELGASAVKAAKIISQLKKLE